MLRRRKGGFAVNGDVRLIGSICALPRQMPIACAPLLLGPQDYQLRPELRDKLVFKDGKVREQDVVIVGRSKGWLGSHKTYVKGAK